MLYRSFVLIFPGKINEGKILFVKGKVSRSLDSGLINLSDFQLLLFLIVFVIHRLKTGRGVEEFDFHGQNGKSSSS